MKLTYRLMPEVLFFKLVTEEEVQAPPDRYYEEYVERIDHFTKRQIETMGDDFFTDQVFVDYYRVVFNTLSSFFIQRKLWDVELEVLQYSALFNSLTAKQMVDTGIALMNLGEVADAEGAFKKALTIEPTDRRGHVQLGRLYLVKKQYEDAQKEFETALRLGDKFSAYYGMGMVAYDRGDTAEAQKLLKKAMESANSKTPEPEKEAVRTILYELADTAAEPPGSL
jgi:tetratricopeptide (TPR) repeat protein